MRSGSDRQLMIETELRKFGVRNVVWLEGDACEPGTSGHVDGYVLLAPSGAVLVDALHLARGRIHREAEIP